MGIYQQSRVPRQRNARQKWLKESAEALCAPKAYLLASTIGMFAANSRLISKSRRRSI
jgi:hypothetical protein